MGSETLPEHAPPTAAHPGHPEGSTRLKIVILGGFGAGKTTVIKSVSEVAGIFTEAQMTRVGEGVDDLQAIPDKTTTTVAMDYGRLTLDAEADEGAVVLYLFGVPGQTRFMFLWNDLVRGALGAILLLDTRRVTDSYDALGLLEHNQVPFVVAVNRFPGSGTYAAEEIRDALRLPESVPVIEIDARRRDQGTAALEVLVSHLLTLADP